MHIDNAHTHTHTYTHTHTHTHTKADGNTAAFPIVTPHIRLRSDYEKMSSQCQNNCPDTSNVRV